MFNRTVINPTRTQYVTRSVEVELHEHRAPTDESLKLLREMEEKVQASFIRRIDARDTAIPFETHSVRDALNDKLLFISVFSINGNRREIRTEVSSWDIRDPKFNPYDKIIADLSRDIAEVLLLGVPSSSLQEINFELLRAVCKK